jgi:hypothetical protein
MADLHFENTTNLASVLWQNGLLGYVDESGGRRFYSMSDVEQFHLPPDARTYTLHPCLTYAVGGIKHVQEGAVGSRDARRRTRPFPSALRKPLSEASASAPEPDPAEAGFVAAAKAADYAVGDVIDGRFEILQELGRGGFSKVYRVRDNVESKERAFKLFDSAAGYEAVRREIGALREVHHPNVVEVFWAGQTATGGWYLITEFIEGESLDEFVTGKRNLRDREAVDVALDLLDALVAFHPDVARLKQLDAERSQGNRPETESDEWTELTGRGLIHRDIKPRN